MKRKLLARVGLANGLSLKLWDESRRVAGDRWNVRLRATVAVSLSGPDAAEIPPEILSLWKGRIGHHICYHQLEERHFIEEADVVPVIGQLKSVFLGNTLSYLSHPEFARRFLLQKCKETQSQMQLGERYLQKTLDALKGPSCSQTEPGYINGVPFLEKGEAT